MTSRDRRIMLAVIPVVVVIAYWFLLLSPQRQEASKATKDLAEQQQRVTAAQGRVSAATSSKTTFAADYTEMVRLGKAIPSVVDMPSLIVQLDRASGGTGIRFTKIATGERQAESTTPPAAGNGSGGGGKPPVAAGGEKAQSAPGGQAETANNAAAGQNKQAASANSNANANSSGKGTGGKPDTGGSTATSQPAGSPPPAGLETVPLDLEFEGNFFNLADFFHRVKRLVRLNNENVVVSGRLITIDSIKYSSDPELFPKITAELKATVYLSPQEQGVTAGATSGGPAQGTPVSTGQPPAPGGSPSTPPAATATSGAP